MNTYLVGITLTVTCASALAQGTVIFNNRIAGTLVTHVYGPDPANPTFYQAGYGINDFPEGPTVGFFWDGALLSGLGWSAQLWAAPGLDQPESALQPATPITSFRTGSNAGLLAGTTATLTGVPADSAFATVTLRVWDNRGGTITSWDQPVWSPRGESPLFNLSAIGGTFNPAPALVGLESFNVLDIPEPSLLALAWLGAGVLVLAPRK